jgi:hypothetical protein
MEWIGNNWKAILEVIGGTIAVASIIVKLTPTPRDDEFLAKVVKFVAILSLNKTNLTK